MYVDADVENGLEGTAWGRVSWDEVREWHDIYTLPNVK